MRNYYGYIRVSTARQGERGVSLQEQRDAISRYAQTHELALLEWFEERITAAKSGRPIFGRMLKGLREGKAEGVIIHKIDRSARNLRDWAHLGELLDAGLDVRFAHEALDLNSRGGRLSADIQAVVAADYIRNLREETRKGIQGRLKQGLLPLPAPLGYQDNGGGKPKTICPLLGPLVRQAFEMYASGQYPLYALTEKMSELGVRNRFGAKVSRSGWVLVLRNPFYAGVVRIKSTGASYKGIHQTLISQALFDQVQNMLDGRRPKRSRVHDYVFRQLFSCRQCGNYLIGERQKGRVYYRCHTRSCRLSCIREDAVEAAIMEELAPLRFSPTELKALKKSIERMEAESGKEEARAVESLRLQIAAVKARLDRLTDAYVDHLIDKETYENRRLSLLQEQQRLEEQAQRLASGEGSVRATSVRILELAESLYSAYEIGVAAEKRDILKNVFSNRIVAGKYVELSMRIPYQAFRNRPVSGQGCPLQTTTRTWGQWVTEVTRLFMSDVEAGTSAP